VVFTSGNGVKFFFQRFFEKKRDIRELKGIKICAVGSKTASEIEKYGIRVDLIPEEFNAEGLVKAFMEEHRTQNTVNPLKGLRILFPRAEVARDVFPQKIRVLGGHIDIITAYRITIPEIHGKRLRRFLKEGRITVATFTSAATFNNFLSMMDNEAHELLRGVAIAVIGPVTAKAVEKAGLTVHIMPIKATIDAMAQEIVRWVQKKR
jgi:uroporphyrinogen III methyltransferase/synthase